MSDAFTDPLAERAILGAILLDESQARGTFARASQILRCAIRPTGVEGRVEVESDFATPAHSTIYAAIVSVLGAGIELDVRTIADQLRRWDRLNTVGGAQYLGELTDEILTGHALEAHARMVRRLADARRVDAALSRARAELRSIDSPDDAIARAMDTLRASSELTLRNGPRPFGEHALEAWSRIEAAGAGDVCPLTFGLPRLDDITGGFAAGQVITIAGAQGRGKTALLAQVLEHNARAFMAHATARGEAPSRILWWSLEMSGAEMLTRHAAWDCSLTQAQIRDGRLSAHQLQAVAQSLDARSALPIDFDGTGDVSALDVRAYTYASPAARIVAVDWIGLLQRHPEASREAKAHDLVAASMKTLKRLALSRHVAVLVLNQFTQEGNRNGKPGMHDMLGGASVVNDSDLVLLMHSDKEIGGGTVAEVTLRVEKSRSSRRGVVEAIFDSGRGTFRELARGSSADAYDVGGWGPSAGDAE